MNKLTKEKTDKYKKRDYLWERWKKAVKENDIEYLRTYVQPSIFSAY